MFIMASGGAAAVARTVARRLQGTDTDGVETEAWRVTGTKEVEERAPVSGVVGINACIVCCRRGG